MKSAKLLAVIVAATSVACTLGGPAWAEQSAPADLFSRPEADAGPTRVSVGVWVANIDNIDSVTQTFSAHIFAVIRWRDARLAQPEGREQMELGVDEIWTPSFIIVNAASFMRNTLPEVVEVDPEGNVTHRESFIGTFAQSLDLRDFPFDKQVFRVYSIVPRYSPDELALVPDEEWIAAGLSQAAGIADDSTVPDWKITGWAAGPRPYEVVPGIEVAGYVFEFDAKRYPGHYILKVILPLVLIVMMSWTVFWIDPENASSQISVAVTSMLTLIAYRFAVGRDVPPIPYTTRLDTFILGSTALVFLSLLQVMVTARLARREQVTLARRIDRWSRVLVPLAFAVVAVLSLVV